jgi:hypothetical protein
MRVSDAAAPGAALSHTATAVRSWHVITPECPPMVGGVSEHTRILAGVAVARGLDVHVWGPGGSAALPGVHVDDGLGGFNASDLAHTGRLLDRCPGPRRLVLQWVPHGYGRRGLNVAFSRWIARRARAGDELDVIVHEPFVDFTGGSWAQPARAVVQRYMAREILSPARRIWIAIPGWERRLRAPWLTLRDAPRVLPVPGTIPVARDAPCVLALRQRLAGGAARLVGYFGTGGEYAERALAVTVQALSRERDDVAFVCLGRGSLEVAARLARAVSGCRAAFSGTGTLALRDLSHHLQACDVMLQPYVDGVSGRRTTTISALEHELPVATTFGRLSEPFWRESPAVETRGCDEPAALAGAVRHLLEPARHAGACASAGRLYAERFHPDIALAPLFGD